MRLGLFIGAIGIVVPTICLAQTKPPQITWEWFNAAEAYRHYAKKSAGDLTIAAHYYRMAAEKGNAPAAYKLGEMYENGEGVSKSETDALVWYRKAADAGDKYGQFRVGWFYQKGLGRPADPTEAARWYRLSAEQDNEWAYDMLAFMLADGLGVAKDEKLAQKYFELSLPRTKDNWARLKLATLIQAQDPKRARVLLQLSAAAGNAQALAALSALGK
jgi:TPR repeat protein